MSERMTRIPVAMAGLALVAVTAVACGTDDGDEPTATDSSTPTSPASESSATAPTESGSPTATPTVPDDGPSPIINKAVKAAIDAKFPALISVEIPSVYTVVDAKFDPADGGSWTIHITDQNGDPITLVQTTDSVEDLVAATVGAAAKKTGTINLRDFGLGMWKQYEGGSQLAIARPIADTSVVVTGSTQSQAVSLAKTLFTAEDSGNTDGG